MRERVERIGERLWIKRRQAGHLQSPTTRPLRAPVTRLTRSWATVDYVFAGPSGCCRRSRGCAYRTSAVMSLAARSRPATSFPIVSRSSGECSSRSSRLRRYVAYNLSPLSWFLRSWTILSVARPRSSSAWPRGLWQCRFHVVQSGILDKPVRNRLDCVVILCRVSVRHVTKGGAAYASSAANRLNRSF